MTAETKGLQCEGCHCFLTYCSKETQEQLLSRAHMIYYPSGALIFDQGSPANGVYTICQGGGFIRSRERNGRNYILRIFAPFELLGALEILTDQALYNTSAQAAKPTQAIFIGKGELLYSRTLDHSLNIILSRLAAREALTYERQLVRILQPGVKKRLIAILSELNALHGLPHPQGHLIDLKLTNTELAEMVGCSIESVSHVVCKLRQRGWLLRRRGKFVLCDCRALDS